MDETEDEKSVHFSSLCGYALRVNTKATETKSGSPFTKHSFMPYQLGKNPETDKPIKTLWEPLYKQING